MRKLIQFLVVILIPFNFCFAQGRVSLIIFNVAHCKNTNELLLYYKITNEGDCNEIFYKPAKDDFCNGLLFLKITDIKSHRTGFYFPCTGKEQLDNILLDTTNTFLLKPKQSYKSFIRVKNKHLSLPIKKHKPYSLFMSINYDNLESTSAINVYKNKLTSNKATFGW